MSLVYLLLKALVKLILWLFYPETTVIGGERLDFKGPAILISNHPNTLMDPLQVASRVRKQLFFLANASLFKSPFTNWLFNTLYCIPIKRKQDDGGKKGISNEDSFARCDEFLGAGGVLFIAPEGGSEMERRLRPFKTGTARIAFSAEQKQAFQLGLTILPVGLNYDQPNHFGTKCLVKVGEPVRIADWQSPFETDPNKTIKVLTEHLEAQTRALVIDTKDAAQEALHRQLEELQQNEKPLPVAEHFRRSQQLAEDLKVWAEAQPLTYKKLEDSTKVYQVLLEQSNITDVEVKKNANGNVLGWFGLLLGFPFFLYGAINHLFAAGIPALVARKIDIYIGYQATVKAIVALISFPLFYWLQYKMMAWVLPAPAPFIYLLSLPIMGWFAWKYWGYWKSMKKQWTFDRLTPETKRQLLVHRESICSQLR